MESGERDKGRTTLQNGAGGGGEHIDGLSQCTTADGGRI